MAQVLRTFPDLPRHSYRVALDGETYRVSFAWMERTAGWYFTLETVDGDTVVRNRRLAGESSLLRYVADPAAPPGVFLVRGPDDYRREALGETLLVVYYEEAEIGEPSIPGEENLTVV